MKAAAAMRRVMPISYLLGGILLAAALHLLLPVLQLLEFPWRLAGLLPLLAGVVLNILADRAFSKHATPVRPDEKPTLLITSGPYGITRHPMYLGMTLMLLGIAILLGSVTPYAAVLVVAVIFDRVFITFEERVLGDAFGDGYRRYRRRVRRWI